MHVTTRSLLEMILMFATKLPGRKALLLLPAVALYGRTDPEFLRVKADSAASGTSMAPSTSSSNGAASAALGDDKASGLTAMLSKLMGSNEFASGGLTLMLVGAAAAGARVALTSALRHCRRHVMITAEIDSRDDAYRWVMHWLSQHPRFRNSTWVSVTTNLNCFGTAVAQQPLGATSSSSSSSVVPGVAYLPAPGDHLLSYQGKWMCISRRRATGNPQLAANARLLLETLSISMLGTSRQALDALLHEAAASYHASQSSRTSVHSCDADGYWTQVGSRPIRPLDTVVLPQGQADALLRDCQEFLSSEEWYAHHGIPYRRGYLLYGPPGTGKTSLVMALAGALGLDIYVVTLSSPTMTDETLRHLLNSAGARSILLLEDVDAAFVERTAAAGAATSRLTFSGLLNAIDGVAAQEGRLLFMTTNHIDRLSKALIRPGRVDVRCYLGPATKQQAQDLFVAFYRDLPHGLLGQQFKAVDLVSMPEAVSALDQERVQPAEANAATAAAAADGTNTTAPLKAIIGAEATSGGDNTQQQQQVTMSGSRLATSLLDAADREALLQELASQFASHLPGNGGVSMAQLQGYLMTHRKDPWAAAANAQQLLQQQQGG